MLTADILIGGTKYFEKRTHDTNLVTGESERFYDRLLERVWGAAYSQEIEFVWVYIRRLRRKIEPDPANPRYILTVPGVGYRLARH